MTAANMIRIATTDTTDAVEIACSEVKNAVGLPVRAEFQEIEGRCLIVELRVGAASVHTPPPSRLAVVVDRSSTCLEVLGSWKEPSSVAPHPRRSDSVLSVLHDAMPSVAHRALHDRLPTAQWESNDESWHLAVPEVRVLRPTVVGILTRRGYTSRFSSLEAVAIRRGLAS
jgi:hypothetical protein